MEKQSKREYKLSIDPKILRLLGPNLYTNIYFVLAELISNAYDADAENVYIIPERDRITVEDDGIGMSYKVGVKKYLNVADETRTNATDSFSKKGRRKMGRKGVGKLAALSVSERVLVKTKQGDDSSGFILSREISKDGFLEPLQRDKITFKVLKANHGTSVVMEKPRYPLSKTISSIKKNMLKIFPLINKDFKIHIIADGKEHIIDSFDSEIITQLGGLIVIGKDFWHLAQHFKNDFKDAKPSLLKKQESEIMPIKLKNKAGKEKYYEIKINGWIGVYRSTRDRKMNYEDFPDNFISIFANKKLGEYNLLPIVGKNRLNEVYVVGQLHVDIFEETELPDMALSNRQGYKTDDPRYQKVIAYVRDKLLADILEIRKIYSDCRKIISEAAKLSKQKEREELLKVKVEKYKHDISREISKKLSSSPASAHAASSRDVAHIRKIVENESNALLPIMELKSTVDSQKKKILISHTSKDKDLADIVYAMLIYNNMPPEDIIYTSSEDETSRPPNRQGVFDYLRKFFVESISKQGIYVIFITSKDMRKSWGAPVEAGAGWITQVDHEIFNIHGYRPEEPLNTKPVWHTTIRKKKDLLVSPRECDRFAVKIEQICKDLGYKARDRESNKKQLERYMKVGR